MRGAGSCGADLIAQMLVRCETVRRGWRRCLSWLVARSAVQSGHGSEEAEQSQRGFQPGAKKFTDDPQRGHDCFAGIHGDGAQNT